MYAFSETDGGEFLGQSGNINGFIHLRGNGVYLL
jgi:hypothetical protein